LSSPGINAAALGDFFGTANVDVALDGSDLQKVLDGGQGSLDSLLTSLDDNGTSAADSLYLDVGAVQALAAAGLNFNDASITVEGTAFLSSGQSGLAGLLGDSDLTLRFDSADIAALIEGGDTAIAELERLAAGFDVDTLEFTAGDLTALAEAFGSNTATGFSAGFDGADLGAIDIVGTGFLSDGNSNGGETGLGELFGTVDDGLVLDPEIVRLLGNPPN
jgi:hypothetical protein